MGALHIPCLRYSHRKIKSQTDKSVNLGERGRNVTFAGSDAVSEKRVHGFIKICHRETLRHLHEIRMVYHGNTCKVKCDKLPMVSGCM